MKNPKEETLKKLKDSIDDRIKLGVFSYEKLGELTLEDLKNKHATYHGECYKEATNKTKLSRLKQNFDKCKNTTNLEWNEDKDATIEQPKKRLRSQSVIFDRELCVICQISGGKLHQVMRESTGRRMFELPKKVENKDFFLRLNTIPNAQDAVANEVKYHLKCWVSSQRLIGDRHSESLWIDERLIADIEIVNAVRFMLEESEGKVLTMNDINDLYNDILKNENRQNYKQYLKGLLQDSVNCITFTKANNPREPERVCLSVTLASAVDNYQSDDFFAIAECARRVRKDIVAHEPWSFTGNFSGFNPIQSLQKLIQWVIFGTKYSLNIADSDKRCKKEMNVTVNNICQIIMKSTKTQRQMSYKTARGSKTFRSRIHAETPLSVGLGLHIHKETRSKKVIDCLSVLNLTISYDRIMKIETEMANATTNMMSQKNGVYVPPSLTKGHRLHFAIDNTDFHNDTPDGKSEFHGTGQVVFQKSSNLSITRPTIERTSTSSIRFGKDPFANIMVNCEKPKPPNESFPLFTGIISCEDLHLYRYLDRCWALCQVFDETKVGCLPPWAAYNSLISDVVESTTCQVMPLFPGSPTDWSNLFTSLKLAQGLNIEITGSKKTIITLDLQLYSKASS